MKLNERYLIESDKLNVTVYEITVAKEGKRVGEPIKKAVGYLTTVEQAYKFVVDREIKGTGMTDFKTIMSKINELHQYIKEEFNHE